MVFLQNKISFRKFKVVNVFSDGDMHLQCVETGINYISRKYEHIEDDWIKTEEEENV